MPVIINGMRFEGNDVSIINGRVMIDGKAQGKDVSGVVELRVTEGTLVSLRTDAAVHCGDVAGDVQAGMQVDCGDVSGNVKAGMSVDCGDVSGDVRAGMGVTMKGRR